MFRTAEAASIDELILTGITPYPPHKRIPKTALGAVEMVNWKHIQNKREAVDYVAMKMPLLAVELTDSAVIYSDQTYHQPTGLIFGNEISGVSLYALKKSTGHIRIPMFGQKESLNVATAFGIVIYEIIRQIQST